MKIEKNITYFLNPRVQLDRFDDTNFIYREGKLFFLFAIFKVAYVFNPKLEPFLETKDDDSDTIKIAWKKHEKTW